MSSSIDQTPTFSCDVPLSQMIEIWMRNHLVSDCNFNTVKCIISQFIYFYKERQIVLGLHLVLETNTKLQFTISIEQDD